MCDRYRKCMEISVFVRRNGWGSVYFDLSGLPADHGDSRAGVRVCHGTCQPLQRCGSLRDAGTERNKVALDKMDWYSWQLSADDVLYFGGGLDAVLLFQEYPRRLCGSRSRGGRGRICGNDGKCAGDGILDFSPDSGGFCHLLVWNPERN